MRLTCILAPLLDDVIQYVAADLQAGLRRAPEGAQRRPVPQYVAADLQVGLRRAPEGAQLRP
ncbi:MAG: hypothetical protein ABL982_21030, partial [Vicinamibacterales bacterium]